MLNELSWVCREIWRRPGRTGLLAFSYAVSVTVAIVAFMLFRSARRETATALRVTGAHFIGFVLPEGAATDDPKPKNPAYEGFETYGHPTALLCPSIFKRIAQLPAIGRTAPWLSFRLRWPDTSERTVLLGGFDPADMETVRMAGCSATEVVAGRELKPDDVGGALLEQTFAETTGLSVGDRIELAGRACTVVGLLSPGTRPAKADVYLSLSDAAGVVESRLTGPLNGRVNAVLVSGRDACTHNDLIAAVRTILGPRAATGGYGCFEPAGQAIQLSNLGMSGLVLLLAFGLALWAARTQYAFLISRRREIGILKAIGWSNRQVGRHALLEAVVPLLLGGLAGVVTGALVGGRLSGTDGLTTAIVSSLMLVGGVASGVAHFAASMVAQISPAEVLRRG